MGIFSSDEDPSWTDIINYQGKIEELEQENRKLKKKLTATKCYNCGETFLTPEGAELYEENVKYKEALEKVRKFLENNLLVKNVGDYQMIYYSDFSEFKNDMKVILDEVLK